MELPNNSTPAKQALRKKLRERRRALTPSQQKQAAIGLCRHLAQLPEFLFGQRIAAYIPNDGEIDPQSLLEMAWRLGKEVYLPVLHPFLPRQLLFMPYQPHQQLARNRYGIPEPLCRQVDCCPVWTLDLVLTPLVGFDAMGNRMGMGGGFYDRTFAFLDRGTRPRQPSMVGVAHDCQKVDELPSEPWDIAMKRIVTDGGVYTAR